MGLNRTQRNFRNEMKRLEKEAASTETFYSYVENKDVNRYYIGRTKKIKSIGGIFLGLILIGLAVFGLFSVYQSGGNLSLQNGKVMITKGHELKQIQHFEFISQIVSYENEAAVLVNKLIAVASSDTKAPDFNLLKEQKQIVALQQSIAAMPLRNEAHLEYYRQSVLSKYDVIFQAFSTVQLYVKSDRAPGAAKEVNKVFAELNTQSQVSRQYLKAAIDASGMWYEEKEDGTITFGARNNGFSVQ